MRVSEEQQRVTVAQTNVMASIDQLQRQYDLTDIQMILAVSRWVTLALSYTGEAPDVP